MKNADTFSLSSTNNIPFQTNTNSDATASPPQMLYQPHTFPTVPPNSYPNGLSVHLPTQNASLEFHDDDEPSSVKNDTSLINVRPTYAHTDYIPSQNATHPQRDPSTSFYNIDENS